MKKLILMGIILLFGGAVFGQNISALLEEFQRRESMALSPAQAQAVKFLKTLPYDTQGIIEMDILEPRTQFVFKDRNGYICYGDSVKSLLRCKNEMGITGVTFQGDAD